VSSNLTHDEVVIKFVNDLRPVSSTNKTDITEILFKVVLNTLFLTLQTFESALIVYDHDHNSLRISKRQLTLTQTILSKNKNILTPSTQTLLNKTDITEILFKVVLNTLFLTLQTFESPLKL
jgi:tRNA U34 5-methylaminomethyl-2-thiouridine-forming methyltransferase MnmC